MISTTLKNCGAYLSWSIVHLTIDLFSRYIIVTRSPCISFSLWGMLEVRPQATLISLLSAPFKLCLLIFLMRFFSEMESWDYEYMRASHVCFTMASSWPCRIKPIRPLQRCLRSVFNKVHTFFERKLIWDHCVCYSRAINSIWTNVPLAKLFFRTVDW